MLSKSLHIKKPSKELLAFVRTLQENKEESKRTLVAQKDKYFKK